MRRALLFLTCISLFSLVWMLFEFEKQSFCFQSNNVSSIQIYSDVEADLVELRLPVCPDYLVTPAYADQAELEPILHQALIQYDQLIEVTKKSVRPAEIIVTRHPDLHYSIESHRVVLGEKAALSEGMLFKALITQWLLQINSGLMHEKLLLEILSDFYFSVVAGKIEIANPVNGSITDLGAQLKMEDHDYSYREMCLSPWVPGSFLTFCASLDRITRSRVIRDKNFKLIVTAVDRIMGQWSQFSLRPIYDYLLWRSYLNAGLSERLAIARNLSNKLAHEIPKVFSWEEDNPPLDRSEQVFKDIESLIEFWQKSPAQ